MSNGISRENALSKAFEFIYKSDVTGVYCEFGVYQGVSLIRAIKAGKKWNRKTGNENIKEYFGFDSFMGLPEILDHEKLKDYNVFEEGQFGNTSIQEVYDKLARENIDRNNIFLVEGLFQTTLVSSEIVSQFREKNIAIAHIDCDLYNSAKQCLSFLTCRICDGAIFLFDDWFCYKGHPDYGVRKAFNEWRKKENYLVSDYFNYSWAGKAFIINEPVVS